MEITTHRKLFEYHIVICQHASDFLTSELLVEKIRQAPTKEEGLEVHRKFRDFQDSLRFFSYEKEQKMKTIKNNLEILDFFGISYPQPPEEITHLFQTEKPNGKEVS